MVKQMGIGGQLPQRAPTDPHHEADGVVALSISRQCFSGIAS